MAWKPGRREGLLLSGLSKPNGDVSCPERIFMLVDCPSGGAYVPT